VRDVLQGNPFATRKDIEPGKLLVTFLAKDPGQEARDKVLAMKIGPEELRMGFREYYVYSPAAPAGRNCPRQRSRRR